MLLRLVSPLGAEERLCDPQYENCREPLLNLIRDERLGIDVAFWFMEDARYVQALADANKAGVPIRVLVDQNANTSHPYNATILTLLRDAGIPMRDKTGTSILHFKTMLFHGLNLVQFSKANYGPYAFVPVEPNVDYHDEVIFTSSDNTLTDSFRRRFDDLWVDTTLFQNFANVTGPLERRYPWATIHPSMNFSPLQDFANRAVARFDRETERIDAIAFRITDNRMSDAILRALQRRVPVRLLTEPDEYRDPRRLWHSKHVDKFWYAGAQIKHRQHAGVLHQASVVLRGLGEVIFGSSNWTIASANRQDEHNYFYAPSLGKPWFFQWFADQFDSKWNDTTNYMPFQPLPPGKPSYIAPQNASADASGTVTLIWDGGTWAHLYDIYFGSTPTSPRIVADLQLGSPVMGARERYTVTSLQPGTTYYWRIVGKTWAHLENSGPTWSFTTSGIPPGGTGSTPYGGLPASVPGTIQAEAFDEGGNGFAYVDTTADNIGGAYRTNTGVDIAITGDPSNGGLYVGWTRVGEWLQYTAEVAETDSYAATIRVANAGHGAGVRILVDGVDRTGTVALPDTGGWDRWQNLGVDLGQLVQGRRVIRLVMAVSNVENDGVGNYGYLSIGSTTPPGGTASTPYGGSPTLIPGIVQIENFDDGGQGLAYFDSSPGNTGGAYRSTSVDIAPTGDAANGGFYVGWTRIGEWLQYTVDVSETRSYTMTMRIANAGYGATFRLLVDGVDRTGAVRLPNTGGWDRWQNLNVGVGELAEGKSVIRLVMVATNAENDGVGNYGYLWF